MKNKKSIISLLISLVFILSMSVSAFAATYVMIVIDETGHIGMTMFVSQLQPDNPERNTYYIDFDEQPCTVTDIQLRSEYYRFNTETRLIEYSNAEEMAYVRINDMNEVVSFHRSRFDLDPEKFVRQMPHHGTIELGDIYDRENDRFLSADGSEKEPEEPWDEWVMFSDYYIASHIFELPSDEGGDLKPQYYVNLTELGLQGTVNRGDLFNVAEQIFIPLEEWNPNY